MVLLSHLLSFILVLLCLLILLFDSIVYESELNKYDLKEMSLVIEVKGFIKYGYMKFMKDVLFKYRSHLFVFVVFGEYFVSCLKCV